MTERTGEPRHITALRFGVFVCAFALFFLAFGMTPSAPWVLLGVAAFAVAADTMMALLGGARGRRLMASAAASAAVWACGVAFLYQAVAADFLAVEQWYLGWAELAAALLAVVVLPRAQALWMWLFVSTVATGLVLGRSSILPTPEQAPVVAVVALLLAAGSTGALGYYLRGVIAQRLGWRHVGARLGLIALAVGFSVVVSVVAATRVAEFNVADNQFRAQSARILYASNVSRTLSSAFEPSAFASPTPALERELVRFSELNDVGLSIYDAETGRVTIAVRRVARPKSTLPSITPDPSPEEDSLDVLTSVQLPAREQAAIVSAGRSLTTGPDDSAASSAVGVLPPHAAPLGWRDDSSFPSARVSVDATPHVVSRVQPNGERFALIDSELAGDWTEQGGQDRDQFAAELSAQLAPWLFFAFMLPCALGLIALDRRDLARAKLVASEERSRLNRDAHDRVYNRLTALANQLAAAQPADTPCPTPADEIRRTVSDLQSILGDGGAPARASGADAALSLMTDVAADQARIWSMEVALEGADALRGIDPRVGWELACIAEEALTNAGKHGHAEHARVTLTRTERTLTLAIADDGIGVQSPLRNGLPEGASGTRGIAERASALGGALEIGTGPGGTTVMATIPLASS